VIGSYYRLAYFPSPWLLAPATRRGSYAAWILLLLLAFKPSFSFNLVYNLTALFTAKSTLYIVSGKVLATVFTVVSGQGFAFLILAMPFSAKS
jgi:hypothetical protein